MRISDIAILALKGTGADGIEKLADALDVSTRTVYRYIDENDDNLTKAAALQVIRGITGLPDTEILTGTVQQQN